MHNRSTYPLSDFINFHVEKIEVIVKMLRLKQSLANHLVRHLPLRFHHQFQHFIIRLARESDLSGVKLEDRTSNGPHVQRVIVRVAYDLRKFKKSFSRHA